MSSIVEHGLESARLEVTNTQPHGPSASGTLSDLDSLLKVISVLDDITDDEGVTLTFVGALGTVRDVVVEVDFLGLGDLLREAGNGGNKTRESHRGEGVTLVGVVDGEDVVVGEGATAEVKSTVLNEVTVSGGFAPGAHHRALHLDEVRQHVHSLDSIVQVVILAHLVVLPLVKRADTVSETLHFLVDLGLASLDVGTLDHVHVS